MNNLTTRILIMIFLFVTEPLFGFYDLFHADRLKYQAKFKGVISIDSMYIAYQNTNAVFSVNYALIPEDHTDKRDQRLMKWVFTKLYDHNLSDFFVEFFYSLFDTENDTSAYSIQLSSGQLLLVDRNGSPISDSSRLQLLMPIILSKGYVNQSQNVKALNNKDTLFINLEGWDLFNVRPTNDIIRPMIETNEKFIRGINNTYSQQRKKSDDYLYWIQSINTLQKDPQNKLIARSDALGFYLMNKKHKTVDRAVINIYMNLTINYQFAGFSVPVIFKIDGQLLSDIQR
ncbi:MAG: hypothetical protein ACRCTJ_01415 [Brevinema sp.]